MPNSFSIPIKYYNGTIDTVDSSTKQAVKRTVKSALDKIRPDFFKGLSFHVVSDFSNLDEHNAIAKAVKYNSKDYKNSAGFTHYGPNREIYVTEQARGYNFFKNLVPNNWIDFNENYIENTTMHEIGHQFDDYFYCEDKTLEDKYRQNHNLFFKENLSSKQEKELDKLIFAFNQNNGLSDSKEFKKALEQDLSKIDIKKVQKKFNYYVEFFFEKNKEKNPTKKDIDYAWYSRGEVFAQLFSYAMGTDDGSKEEFTKMFPAAYKMVKNYIQKYSKK